MRVDQAKPVASSARDRSARDQADGQGEAPDVPRRRWRGSVLRLLRGAPAYMGIFALLTSLQLMSLLPRIDAQAMDALQRFIRTVAPRSALENIVIVGIDEESDRLFPQPFALWHAPIGATLRAVAMGQPKLVVLDVVLPERSYENYVEGIDAQLLAGVVALKRPDRLVAAQSLDARGRTRPIAGIFMSALPSDALGLAYVNVDRDGVARDFRPATGPRIVGTPLIVERIARHLNLQVKAGLIDFTLGEPFDYVPMQHVIALPARNPDALRKLFHEKIVMIGKVGPDDDPVRQPISLARWAPASQAPPGIVHIAQSVCALQANRVLSYFPSAAAFSVVLLCGAIVLVPGMKAASLAGVSALLLIGAAAYYAFLHGIAFSPASPGLAIVLGVGVRAGVEAVEQRLARQRVEQQFKGYVSENLLSAIQSGEVDPNQPRFFRRLGFLFADLRGFTTMSEALPPERMVELLNRYYRAITPAIHAHEGIIDNFRGDGILAVFGAPKANSDAPRQALLAARDMFQSLAALNIELRREDQPPLDMSVGLACGDAVVGHIGTSARHCYSAIGDAVNVAARLQGKCKALQMRIIATASMTGYADGVIDFIELGELDIDGHARVAAVGIKL